MKSVIHLRKTTKQGAIKAHGGATVAYELRLVKDETGHADNLVARVGLAVCCDLDNYNRKEGRNLAQQRLENSDQDFTTEFVLGNADNISTVAVEGDDCVTVQRNTGYSIYDALERRVWLYIKRNLAQRILTGQIDLPRSAAWPFPSSTKEPA